MAEEKIINGVNVTMLFEVIDAVKEDSSVGKAVFRAENKWIHGGHNTTDIKGFYAALKEQAHGEPFALTADEHPVFLGKDQGPNPVEYLLTALASCVTSALVYHAAARGIVVRGVESRLEGELDLRGFLGISEDVPVGYKNIHMVMNIDADLSDDEKADLIKIGQKYSPVFNTLVHAIPVSVELER